MVCSITSTKRPPDLDLPDLFDILDGQANLLCTVFGWDVAERLASLISAGLDSGKDRYGVVFAALSRLDCELVAKNLVGDELWWAAADDVESIRAELIVAVAPAVVEPLSCTADATWAD